MKWIEVIRLRVPLGQEPAALEGLSLMVTELMEHRKAPIRICAYQRSRPTGDLIVVFKWATEDAVVQHSRAAQSLLRELRGYGLVDHSVWVDLTDLCFAKHSSR